MSAFHQQAFLAWSLIFKHNVSPHSYIWRNINLFSLNIEFTNTIVRVAQLCNRDGLLYSCIDFFLSVYKIPVKHADFAKVVALTQSGLKKGKNG